MSVSVGQSVIPGQKVSLLLLRDTDSLYDNDTDEHCRVQGNYSVTPNNIKLVHCIPVDGRSVTFGTARRGLGRVAARPDPTSLYQM